MPLPYYRLGSGFIMQRCHDDGNFQKAGRVLFYCDGNDAMTGDCYHGGPVLHVPCQLYLSFRVQVPTDTHLDTKNTELPI